MIICLDISVLNDKQRTGIAVYTYNLIDALLKINKKDKFVLFGIATFDTYNYLKNLDFKKYLNVEMKIYRMPARVFRWAFLIWQWFNRPAIESFVGKVDIFHSFNWYLPPQRMGKVVATVFDMTVMLFPDSHQTKTIQLEKLRINRIKSYADLVITISQNSKIDFLKSAPLKKTAVIYPALPEQFKEKKGKGKGEGVLEKYNLKPGYVLAVGTLQPRKNIRSLIEAYLKSNLKEKLVLAGSFGWESSDLYELIKKHQEKIVTTGYVLDEDLPHFYKQALCLVYPSFYEGFGMPVLEALSLRTPVICSNTSSLPEAGGEAVLYIDPNSIDDIANALIRIKQKELRIKLVNKGLKQSKKFSWMESAKKLNSLYQRLVSL